MRIELPWPDKTLSPNARTHHQIKAKVTKRARGDATYIVYDGFSEKLNIAEIKELFSEKDYYYCLWMFYPPDRRHRDLSNMMGSCKAFQDGIFDAFGVDDRNIKDNRERPGKSGRPGKVVLEIEVIGTRKCDCDKPEVYWDDFGELICGGCEVVIGEKDD